MKHINLCVAGFIVLASASLSAAQTAEETVAFITDGMEDGRIFSHRDKSVSITQTPGGSTFKIIKTPTEYAVPEELTVRALDKCRFDISTTGGGEPYTGYVIDFSHFIGAEISSGELVTLKFASQCPITFEGGCVADHLVTPGFEVEQWRLNKAIDYFKRTFCSGVAY